MDLVGNPWFPQQSVVSTRVVLLKSFDGIVATVFDKLLENAGEGYWLRLYLGGMLCVLGAPEELYVLGACEVAEDLGKEIVHSLSPAHPE